MEHSCQYLCSELVTVTYEEQPGDLRQTVANLEEISTTSAVVLFEEKPSLGAPISLAIKGCDLFGVITSSVYDATLGWFVTVTLDAASLWHHEWLSPKHLLTVCACSFEGATSTKAHTLENTRNTEENVPVSFVVSKA
jgi:hypothetical protein